MKRHLIFSAVALAALAAAARTSTPRGFTDDFEAALAQAKAENKTVVAAFSGSDWCGWCKRLDKEVFSKRDFIRAATNRYVLVFIDKPSDPTLLSERAAAQNPKLIEKYGIKGFPTVLLLDGDGQVLDELGYARGGAQNYLDILDASVAALPYLKEWFEPLTQRFDAVFKELDGGLDATADKTGVERIEAVKPHFARAADALEKIVEEERAKDAPEAVRAKRTALLDERADLVKEFRKIVATPNDELLSRMRP